MITLAVSVTLLILGYLVYGRVAERFFGSDPSRVTPAFSLPFWLGLIFFYYILATLLPIDKIIGLLYPFFGAALIFMAMGVFGGLIVNWAGGNITLMELTPANLVNFQPVIANNNIYPFLFIVVSCGAISGFHATQSPLIARCLRSEKQGRQIFYGAMIAEGIMAIIWATAAMNYMGDVHGLNYAFTHPLADNPDVTPDPAWLVNEICRSWLGKTGAIIAVIGVVACPVTSGDTAFRSARLTIADMLKIPQKKTSSRLLIIVPVFALAYVLTFVMKDEFARIWKFVGISNQALAAITCWTIAMYLGLRGKSHLMMSLPELFLTAVCVTYLLVAPHTGGGLALPMKVSLTAGIPVASAVFALFLTVLRKKRLQENQ